MGAIGQWRKSVLGASGVALLLPLGLALGLVLTSALGGGSTLSALRQVVAGPAEPGGRGGAAAPGLESAARVPEIPVASARRVAASRRQFSTHRPSPGPSTGATRRPQSGGTGHAPAPAPGTGTGGSSGSGGTAPPPPPPAPTGSPVHRVGQQVADQVKQLPPPAGGVAGDAVQTVVDLVP